MSARTRRAASPAPLFAALGDETRLGLVTRLSTGGPASIARLTRGSGVTRQAVAKHLRVLGRAGIVTDSRRGRESVWTLEPRRLEEARRSLDRISRHWDDALARLKVFVEGGVSPHQGSTLSTSARNRSPRSADTDSGGG